MGILVQESLSSRISTVELTLIFSLQAGSLRLHSETS